jgi:maltose alpha-D-glucosyltransferase / alpha-amylase
MMKEESMEKWYKEAVFYEIIPRTFYDANGDGIGDLQGIIQKLDHVKSLGVDCIWLLPIFPSPLVDGGYDIEDYYNIHPQLGTLDDLKALIEAVHAKGMRLILDLVVNHTSDQCQWFKEAEADRNSPYRDYYVWSDTDQKYADARIIFLDTEDSNWTWSEKAQQYYWHRFYSSQPDLNYDNPAVREEMKKIMRFWLDMGIDGFRADAVPYLFEREGTNCENLPETHAYLKEMRAMVDAEYPGRILLAEANQWPKDLMPYLADGNEFHMAFQFPVMPRIYKSVAIGSNAPMLEIMKEIPRIPEDCQWCIFLRNHDELTLEMVTKEDRQFMWDFYAPEPRMRLNQGIRRRLAPLMDGDLRKVELLYAMLFSLPGAPIIYYGDEIGMGDNIWLNDRDGVRTPMQWTDGMNAGFSNAEQDKMYHPVINEGEFSFTHVNVEKADADEDSLYHRLQKLVSVRKAHTVFSEQDYSIQKNEQTEVFAIIRRNNKETVACFHNLSDSEQIVTLEDGYRFLHGSAGLFGEKAVLQETITLQPYGYVWLTKE